MCRRIHFKFKYIRSLGKWLKIDLCALHFSACMRVVWRECWFLLFMCREIVSNGLCAYSFPSHVCYSVEFIRRTHRILSSDLKFLTLFTIVVCFRGIFKDRFITEFWMCYVLLVYCWSIATIIAQKRHSVWQSV